MNRFNAAVYDGSELRQTVVVQPTLPNMEFTSPNAAGTIAVIPAQRAVTETLTLIEHDGSVEYVSSPVLFVGRENGDYRNLTQAEFDTLARILDDGVFYFSEAMTV